MTLRPRLLFFATAAALGAALWWRKNPSACPYSQRFWVQAPHPFITRERLREALAPAAGERMIEIGPGTGYYTLEIAEWLGPDGRLDLVDVQREMLDHTMAHVGERGLRNVDATEADARQTPFDDDTFDAAILITVLGEIPDQAAALREVKRILKPGGRLVVGELFGDPHMVTIGALTERAAAAGLGFERRIGPWVGYFARFGA